MNTEVRTESHIWRVEYQEEFSVQKTGEQAGADSERFSLGVGLGLNTRLRAVLFQDGDAEPVEICLSKIQHVLLLYDSTCALICTAQPGSRAKILAALRNEARKQGVYTDGDGNLRDLAAAIYTAKH